jgi:HAE1 family hydrophobic/amphiphilic exporter-1
MKLMKGFRWFKKRVLKRPEDPDPLFPSGKSARFFKFDHGMRKYRGAVAALIRRRYWMGGLVFVLFVASLFIYAKLDKEFVGKSDENEFTIFVELPSGAKLDVSDKVVGSVEKLLAEVPEIKKSVKTAVARVEGWSSKIYVTLVPSLERTRSVSEVINYLRPLLSQIGGEFSAFVYCSEPESSKEFVVDCYGYDYDRLRDMAIQVSQRMEKVKGLVDVKLRYKPGRPEVRIEVDRQKASMFELTIDEISQSLHAEIRGLRATYFLTPKAQVETIARLQEQYRKNLEDVENLTLINSRGVIVPVRQFAKFEFGLTPSEVWRKSRERMIQASASRQDVALSKVAEGVLHSLEGLQIRARRKTWRS